VILERFSCLCLVPDRDRVSVKQRHITTRLLGSLALFSSFSLTAVLPNPFSLLLILNIIILLFLFPFIASFYFILLLYIS
jgi:hypothetical protein